MKRRHSFFTSTGIPSLFLIFSVLCLAVLSLLTLGNTRSELLSAKQSLKQSEQYYTSCAAASEHISQIQNALVSCYKFADDQKSYYDLVGQRIGNTSGLTWNSSNQTIDFKEQIADTQELIISLKVMYPQSDKDTFLQIQQWQTDSTASWNPDNSQSVYKGGISNE